MTKLSEDRARIASLTSALASPRPMRKGWVGERWMKCGQKECACRHDATARHGPYYSLTTPGAGKGKTKSRYIAPELVPFVREQILAMRAFRENVKAVMREAEQWADAELAQVQAASEEAAKKGASKSSSGRKYRTKSSR